MLGGRAEGVLVRVIRRRSNPGSDFRRQALLRASGVAGMAGPVAFTAAWVAASLRQRGYSPIEIQISGLAAPGARDRWIMVGGFLSLGGSLAAFGPALRQGLGGTRGAGPAPWLLQAAGVLVATAGMLQPDHMVLVRGPGSWHNQAHDALSAANYTLLIAIPLLLAQRLHGDPRYKPLPAALVSAAIAAAVILSVFSATGPNSPEAGVLQRAGVTIPLAALVALAARLHGLRSS
jgi:hypothetical protein